MSSTLELKKCFIARGSYGELIIKSGLNLSVYNEDIVYRSLDISYRKDGDQIVTILRPLSTRRVGPFFDWVCEKESMDYVKLDESIPLQKVCEKISSTIKYVDLLRIAQEEEVAVYDPLMVVFGSGLVYIPISQNDKILLQRILATSFQSSLYRKLSKTLDQHKYILPMKMSAKEEKTFCMISTEFTVSLLESESIIISESGEINKIILDQEVNSFQDLVNPLCGPVRECYSQEAKSLKGNMSYFAVSSDNISKNGESTSFIGGSISDNSQLGESIAIGEAWERGSGSHPDETLISKVRLSDSPELAEFIKRIPLYSEAQYSSPGFPYIRPESKSELHITKGIDFNSGDHVIVPADMVWLSNYDHIVQSTSNGLATHLSEDKAVLSALQELVERDIFLRVWHERKPLSRLRITDLPREIFFALKDIPTELEVSFMYYLWQGQDAPFYFTLASLQNKNFSAGPSCIVGAGFNRSFLDSGLTAALELVRGYEHYLTVFNSLEDKLSRPYFLRTVLDHISWHWVAGRQKYSEHLFPAEYSSIPKRIYEPNYSDAEACDQIALKLKKKGHKVILAAAKHNLYPEYFPVRRVIATGLIPLYFGPGMIRGIDFFNNYGSNLWNTTPHPFP